MGLRLRCLVALLAVALPAAAQDHGTAFARAQHLKRGVNASEWFAQSASDYSAARTNRYTDAQDIALMADGLAVEIDLHPEDNWKQQLRTSNDQVDRLTMLWRLLRTAPEKLVW